MKAHKGRDPIFALIENHAKALKASERADASLASLQKRIDARPSEQRMYVMRRLTCEVPYFDLGGTRYDPAAVIKSRDEIKQHVFGVFDSAARGLGRRVRHRVRAHEREAIAELLRKYDAFQRAHRARRKACGLTARQEAAWKAERAAANALQALMATAPETLEGLGVLAKHLTGLSPAAAPWWVLRAALQRLLPENAP